MDRKHFLHSIAIPIANHSGQFYTTNSCVYLPTQQPPCALLTYVHCNYLHYLLNHDSYLLSNLGFERWKWAGSQDWLPKWNPSDSIVVHTQLSLNRFPMAGVLVGVRSYNLDFTPKLWWWASIVVMQYNFGPISGVKGWLSSYCSCIIINYFAKGLCQISIQIYMIGLTIKS